jgi:hypothetical protein
MLYCFSCGRAGHGAGLVVSLVSLSGVVPGGGDDGGLGRGPLLLTENSSSRCTFCRKRSSDHLQSVHLDGASITTPEHALTPLVGPTLATQPPGHDPDELTSVTT